MVSSLFLCFFSPLPMPRHFFSSLSVFRTFSHGSVWVRARFSFFAPLNSSSLSLLSRFYPFSAFHEQRSHSFFFSSPRSLPSTLFPLWGSLYWSSPFGPLLCLAFHRMSPQHFFARFVFFSSVYFFPIPSPSPCNLSFYMSMNSAVVLPIFWPSIFRDETRLSPAIPWTPTHTLHSQEF